MPRLSRCITTNIVTFCFFSVQVAVQQFVEKPFFQAQPILINISGPNYEQAVSLYPDFNLNYETTLKLVQVFLNSIQF